MSEAQAHTRVTTPEPQTMTKSDDDYPPSFWHNKADEARAMAENMVSEDGKRSMLQIANLYDGLAASSAARREAQRKRQARDPNSDTT